MDDGLIQFLVVAFFIIVSMMDAAARKRRKQAQDLGGLPEPNSLAEAADDLDEAAESSEGMVPQDLWQEIAALARGEVPEREVGSLHGPGTVDPDSTGALSSADDPDSELEAWTPPEQDMPQRSPSATVSGVRAGGSMGSYDRPDVLSPTEARSADLQGGYLHPEQAATHEEHAHEEHAEVAVTARPVLATEPHEYVPFTSHSPEPSGKPQKELRQARQPRSLLAGVRSGAKSSLREAIVLAEVLSPPVTLRDSGWKPLF